MPYASKQNIVCTSTQQHLGRPWHHHKHLDVALLAHLRQRLATAAWFYLLKAQSYLADSKSEWICYFKQHGPLEQSFGRIGFLQLNHRPETIISFLLSTDAICGLFWALDGSQHLFLLDVASPNLAKPKAKATIWMYSSQESFNSKWILAHRGLPPNSLPSQLTLQPIQRCCLRANMQKELEIKYSTNRTTVASH